jgi:hypothetical protein
MTKLKDLHRTLMRNPEYRREYAALEQEFALIKKAAKKSKRAARSSPRPAKRRKGGTLRTK